MALLFCAAGVKAQTAAGQAPEFTMSVDVQRVLVPVVVRDTTGDPVLGLKREDFQLKVNGKPYPISGFTVERRDLRGVKAPGPAAAEGADGGGPAALQKSPGIPGSGKGRFLLFLFDDLHLTTEQLSFARKAAGEMLEAGFEPGDMAAVATTSGKTNSGLTRDRAQLQETLKRLVPQVIHAADGMACPNVGYYQADQIENRHNQMALGAAIQQVFACSPGMDAQRDRDQAERLAESAAMRALTLGHQDLQLTYYALGEFVRRMAGLPGERVVVLISPGFLRLSQEDITEEQKVLDLAARANVTINAMDARGVYTLEATASERSQGNARTMQTLQDFGRSAATSSENPLQELADGTGGRFFHNSNDLREGFRTLTEAASCVYVLELPVGDLKADGSYRRVEVKVNRGGMQVEARRGFVLAKVGKGKS